MPRKFAGFMMDEDGGDMGGRQLLAVLLSAGLEQNRVTLQGAAKVQGPLYG